MLAATVQQEQGTPTTNEEATLVNPWESAKGGGYWSTEDIKRLVNALNTYGHGRWNEMLEDPTYGMKDAGRTPEGIEAKVRRLRKKHLIERISYNPEVWRLREDLLLATLKYNFDKMNPKMRGKLPPPPEIPPPLLPAEPMPKMKKRKQRIILGGIFVNRGKRRLTMSPAWTTEQVERLLEGVNKFGVGNWSAIFFGDPQWRTSESGRQVDDLRAKFLQLRERNKLFLQANVWQLNPNTDQVLESAPPTNRVSSSKITCKDVEPVAARRILPGGKVRKQHVPWTEEEVLALVEGLNRYGQDGVRSMIKDLTLAFNPKRRTYYIIKTKLDTLKRHEIITQSSDGLGRWSVDLNLFRLITKRRKGLSTSASSKAVISLVDEDDTLEEAK